jgi:hypothetical protein
MRSFAEAWEEEVFVQAVLVQNRGSVRIRATEYGKQVSLLCGRRGAATMLFSEKLR